ncbi:MAG: hypothetical protein NTX76_02230 [Alphaproteobacteria bacterium]|nr:hypothetical protein [Alphaproteobacteria bacterium]
MKVTAPVKLTTSTTSTLKMTLRALAIVSSVPLCTMAYTSEDHSSATALRPSPSITLGVIANTEIQKRRAENLSDIIYGVTDSPSSVEISHDFFDAAREYYEIDPVACKSSLFYAVKELNRYPTSRSLKTLALLNELYPGAFLTLAQELFNEWAKELIEAYIETPEVASLFNDTPIHLQLLVRTTLAKNCEPEEDTNFKNALEFILRHLSQFSDYHAEILDAMPVILRNDNVGADKFLPFLKLEKEKADRAFTAILRNLDNKSEFSWREDFFITKLFENYQEFLVNQPLYRYDDLYAISKRHEFLHVLQSLWTHLSEATEPSLKEPYQIKLREQFIDFWDISSGINLHLPWAEFCHLTLDKVVTDRTVALTKVHAFIEAAREVSTWSKTNHFFALLRPELLETVSNLILYDESASLKNRVESLTNKVFHLRGLPSATTFREEILKFSDSIRKAVSNAELLEYAENLFGLFGENVSTYKGAQHKRFFIQFKEKHPEISIPNTLTDLHKIVINGPRNGDENLCRPFVFLNNFSSFPLQPQMDESFIYSTQCASFTLSAIPMLVADLDSRPY